MDTTAPSTATGDVDAPARVLDMQRRACLRDGAPPAEQRLAALRALDTTLRANREQIATAISRDFGSRSAEETTHRRAGPQRWPPSAMPVATCAAGCGRSGGAWTSASSPARAWVEWQPLGCVAIVSPWNYPLLLTVSPLVDALAAGNRVIVKPSELTPRFAALIARLLADAIDPAQLSVVTGGPEVAQAVCALPLDHLLFTGSTAVGRLVAKAAAETLTPVTLELGGKSPAIVCRDYDVRQRPRRSRRASSSTPGRPASRPITRWCRSNRSRRSPRPCWTPPPRCIPPSRATRTTPPSCRTGTTSGCTR